jgi:predicted ATPase
VLFLDDLHWADVSTVDVLNYLAQRFADLRIFVLATYRSAEMVTSKHPFLQVSHELQTRGTLVEFPLEYLGLADVTHYMDLEFPGHALPDAFSALIHEKTGGSPLFMVDLLRDLSVCGAIAKDGAGCWNSRVSISPKSCRRRSRAQSRASWICSTTPTDACSRRRASRATSSTRSC